MARNPKVRAADKIVPISEWPANQIKLWPLDKIKPYPKNTRTHPKNQIALLASLMKRWGVDQPIVVDDTGTILKGHGRLLAAIEAGFEKFPVVQHSGLSKADKMAMRIADNKSALLSGWDEELLKQEMIAIRDLDFDMPLIGFSDAELKEMIAADDEQGKRGALLELIDVTIKDPKHQVEHGDHYVLKERHHLFCLSVIRDWSLWSPLLADNALFCPYPGVFAPFSSHAVRHSIIMVQPDPYIAGHILDRFVEVNGSKSVKRLAQ